MDRKFHFERLNLSEEDYNLRILNCSKDYTDKQNELGIVLGSGLENLQEIDPKQLPHLPFENQSFDLVLCTHVLFVDPLDSADRLINAILELTRVGSEVRIYPLTGQDGKPSQHLGPVIQTLQLKGFGVELKQIRVVAGEEMLDTAMLKIWKESCEIKNDARAAVASSST